MPLVAVAVGAVAVLALLLLYASSAMTKWLAQAVPDWSFPGFSSLRSWVINAAQSIADQTSDWLHSLITPLENIVAGPILAVYTAFQNSLSAVSHLAGLVQWLKNTYLIQWILNTQAFALDLSAKGNAYAAELYSFAEGDITNLRAYSVALSQAAYTEAVGTATTLIDEVDAHAVALSQAAYTEAVGTATGLFRTAEADAAALFSTAASGIVSAEQLARGLFGAAETDIAAALAAAQAYAATTATAAVGVLATDIDHAITTAIGVAWPDIATVIPELEGVIGTGDADILDALGRIDWTIPATLAGVAALLGVTTLTLARYLRDCGIPNCQNLSQLGQDLQALLGLVEDASFLALLVELVEHPGNASHVVQSTFGAGISEAVAGFRSLVSI